MPRAVVVIPARWASSRFPGKVLAPLLGRPLVLHACNLGARAASISEVIVATDDLRVFRTVEDAGFRAEMTDPDLPSGTDRVAAVARDLDADLVVGLQADEPLLLPGDLDSLVEALADTGEPAGLATLAGPRPSPEEWRNPNVVKLLVNASGHAIYFSRAPIPYPRPNAGGPLPENPRGPVPEAARTHVGVYGWRKAALLAFTGMEPSPLERAEGLEQLRAIEAGWPVAVRAARGLACGVDRPEDIGRAETLARTLTNTKT